MTFPGQKTLRRAGRWARSRLGSRAVILGYHRVARVAHDPFGLAVSPDHFAEQLDVIQKITRPQSLAGLHRDWTAGRLPARSGVQTFDDGYADMGETAAPLLAGRGSPATLFVISGRLGRSFWWDELAGLLFTPARLPDFLEIKVEGQEFNWVGGDREELLRRLYDELRLRPPDDREQWLDALRVALGSADSGDRPPRAHTAAELVELAAGGLVEIGAHTVTHPFLAALSPEDQEREIRESREALAALLGRPVAGFSYPNGSLTPTTAALVRAAGFTYACQSGADIVRPGSDPFQWPRFWVPDWDGDAFARWLRRWL